MNVTSIPPKDLKKLEATFGEMKKRAQEDPVYFFDQFLYTFDPKREPFHLRFKTFDFQKRLIRDIIKAIYDGDDLFIEKTREMGATYTVLGVLIWLWLWQPAFNALVGSRKEDYVDNRRGGLTGNKEESLFGKIDYMISRLPSFILPEGFITDKHFNYMSLANPENGNVISGESSNPNFSRGSRRTVILLDEFAFWDNDCFHKDTEVLTDSGWKLIKDCTTDDLVYSMDIDSGEAKLMPVTKLHKVYAEELYEFKSKAIDISCTANHKLLLKKRYQPNGARKFINVNKDKARYQQSVSKMYYRRADEVFEQKHDFIPLTSNYVGGETPDKIYGFEAEDFMEFLGWFVSEGHSSNKSGGKRIGITQDKVANPEKTEQIRELLIRMGLPVKYYKDTFYIRAGAFPEEMYEELCSLGKAHEKYIPQKYLNLSLPLLRPLFDALIKGDGSRMERKGRVDKLGYFTVSERLADNVQELCQKIGLKASISKHEYNNGKWRDIYRLNIGFKQHSQVACLDKKIVPYNDFAYCVTTPYHSLYVRRNGVASWCGNTQVWGATADTTNCRIILTTPGIKPSKAKRLRFGKDGEVIKVITLPYQLDPRKNKKWLEEQRLRRSTEDFNREIMINWELSMTGRVYPEIENAAYGDFPLLLNSPAYYSWDFGLDGVSIGFWQRNLTNGRWRLVDSYHNEDKPIQFYLPLFKQPIDSKFTYTDDDLKAIDAFGNYPPGIHFGDPDVKKRSLLTGTSTRQELEKAKVYVQCIDKNDFYIRREKTKVALQNGIEVNQTPRNEYFMEAIKSARYPERQETSQATTAIALPIHDWTSHPRTMMEYFWVNIDVFDFEPQKEPAWATKARSWLTSRTSIKPRRS